jgi:hypothetical protein
MAISICLRINTLPVKLRRREDSLASLVDTLSRQKF